MRNSRIIIFVLAILTSCKTSIATFQTSDTDKIGVTSNHFRGTIFKSSYPEENLFIQAGDKLNRFTPTKENIALAESILKSQIRKANKAHFNQPGKHKYLEKNLNKYFRQYIGFINEHGDSIIHINFQWDRFTMTDRLKGYWDNRLKYNSDFSQVFDGGSHYWNVNVNLNKKRLYQLSVNGEA
ncbi:MAG TPA: hypothetical protein VFI29_01285 [Hanamia sp.]|nr:hypothetical protein [Hanamia sp.]